jgi:molybdenum cofactor biosynthesis enzyme MoaA
MIIGGIYMVYRERFLHYAQRYLKIQPLRLFRREKANGHPADGFEPPSDDVKICPYPFARMEVGMAEWFSPCCSNWLTPQYFSLESGKDHWNGPAAQELRRRILKGDYSLCRRERCQIRLFRMNELEEQPQINAETPISPRNLKAMQSGYTELPEGPCSIDLSADLRCNLKCPTCRSHLITSLDKDTAERVAKEKDYIWKHRHSLQVVKMSGNGEVFFSPDQREILKRFTREDFPQLQYVQVLSNGLLLNQKTLDTLHPGSEFVKKVSISIDAGTEEVYQDVRGGRWKTLIQNLRWIGEQRASGRFDWFSFLFVVRRANFQTIPQVIDLGQSVGVDQIRFIPFNVWPHMEPGLKKQYEDESVHLPSHPQYSEFLDLARMYHDGSRIIFGMELPNLSTAYPAS